MIRTFLAADLDEPFLDAVAATSAALAHGLRGAPRLSKLRWAARETLHVTLRFFGATSDAQLERLRALVVSLSAGARSTEVRATLLTGFPAAEHARVVVVAIEDGGALAAFAARAEAAAVELGFPAETRAYNAHLTLARAREPLDLRAHSGEAAGLPAGRLTALTLYESKTAASGPIYTPVVRVSLPSS